jgi:hypothetical protein
MPVKLLSSSNAKLQKSHKKGFLSLGLSLSPFTLSGKNFCSHASAGCAASCLNTSGMGRFSNVQAGRLKKSRLFIENRGEFLRLLNKELVLLNLKAAAGAKISVRLNVLSDLPWENLIDMNDFPYIAFMDYTKNPKRMERFIKGELPDNYHLTFSRSESNDFVAQSISASGGNVAVVFDQLPETFYGVRVVDGDETDLRFLDPRPCVVGLIAKGKAKQDDSGFVVKTKGGN